MLSQHSCLRKPDAYACTQSNKGLRYPFWGSLKPRRLLCWSSSFFGEDSGFLASSACKTRNGILASCNFSCNSSSVLLDEIWFFVGRNFFYFVSFGGVWFILSNECFLSSVYYHFLYCFYSSGNSICHILTLNLISHNDEFVVGNQKVEISTRFVGEIKFPERGSDIARFS